MPEELRIAPMHGRSPGGSAPSARPYGQPILLRNGVGRAAFGLGLCSLLFCLMPGVGLGLAALAIVLGVVGVRRARRLEASNHRQAQLGLFAGAVAGVIAVAVSVAVVVLWPQLRVYRACMDNATTGTDQDRCTSQFRHAVDARFQ